MFGHCDVTSYFWCIYLITFPQCLGFCAIPSRHLLPYKFVLYLLLTFFSYWFSFNITIIFQEYVWPLCHSLLNVKHNFSKFADIFTNLTFFHLLYASCIFPWRTLLSQWHLWSLYGMTYYVTTFPPGRTLEILTKICYCDAHGDFVTKMFLLSFCLFQFVLVFWSLNSQMHNSVVLIQSAICSYCSLYLSDKLLLHNFNFPLRFLEKCMFLT